MWTGASGQRRRGVEIYAAGRPLIGRSISIWSRISCFGDRNTETLTWWQPYVTSIRVGGRRALDQEAWRFYRDNKT